MSRFSVETIFKATDRMSTVVGRMEARMRRFTEGASAGLRSLDRINGKVHDGLKRLAAVTLGAGAGLGFVAKNIIDTGADFEEAITAVGAVSLMTRDQIADLEKKALELGASTKFSATEVANGMELMGRAGFTNQQILEGIGGVLNAAAAEGADLAETAGNISNVLKGMGLEVTESTRVADVLTLASARTNSSISSLGESMANVSSTARQFKVPLEDTVAAVALLQDVGLDASEAGSALNTMLTMMAAPSKEARVSMKKLGVSFKDASGNMLPFSDVLGQLQKSAEKSGGNMEQVAFLANLVGLRGQKAASNLRDLFASGKVGELTTALHSAAGSAEKMAKLRTNNFKGDMEQLGGAVDSVKNAIFNMNSGPMRDIVQGMTRWVDKNKEFIVAKVQDTIKEIVDNLPEIVTWLKRVAIGIAVFYAWTVAVKVAQAVTWGITAATWAWATASKAAILAVRGAAIAAQFLTTSTVLATAAQWAQNAAINIGRIATTGFTASTVTGTAAAWASSAATWARTTATGAFNAVIGIGKRLIDAYRNGTLLATAAEIAQSAVIWLKNAAIVAGNAVLAIAAVAHGNFATSALGAAAANGSLVASFAPFLVTVAAATAAVGALYAAWDQWSKLDKETEGTGFFGSVGEILTGTVGAHQDELARKRAAGRPEVASAGDAMLRETRETKTSQVNVDLHAPKGAATVRNPTAAKKNGVRLQPSGAL